MKKGPKQTQTRGWNPVSKSLNKHAARGNESLWKICLQWRERWKTSGPDCTSHWQQDVSSPHLVSAASVPLSCIYCFSMLSPPFRRAMLWFCCWGMMSIAVYFCSNSCDITYQGLYFNLLSIWLPGHMWNQIASLPVGPSYAWILMYFTLWG